MIPIDQTSVDLADDEAVTDAIFEDVFNTADNATIILDQIAKGWRFKIGMTVLSDSCPIGNSNTSRMTVYGQRLSLLISETGCSGLI